MIFDTHAHYDDEQFNEDRADILTGLSACNVGTVVNVGADIGSSHRAAELARAYSFIYAAVGVHPDNAGELEEKGLDEIMGLARSEKAVAIGEIGLDYHWMVQPPEIQEKWFRKQLGLARELKLPVIIHSREAAEDTYRIMADEHAEEIGGVIHCFSYSAEMAEKYVRMGFFIGIGGVVTYKNGKKLKAVAKAVPIENIVLETDCPYLAPEPNRGKRNNSAYIQYVAEELAVIKEMSVPDIIRITEENAKRLYRL